MKNKIKSFLNDERSPFKKGVFDLLRSLVHKMRAVWYEFVSFFDDIRVGDRKYVHALMYANCFHVLFPVVQKLNEDKSYYITVTAKRDARDFDKLRGAGIRVSRGYSLLESFFRSTKKKRMLLNAADFQHPFNLLGRKAVFRARSQDIVTLNIQHGLITFFNLSDPKYFMTSDKFAVWGGFVKKQLVEKQHKYPRDVFVVGNPALDTVFEHIKGKREDSNIHEFLGLPLEEEFILFFSCLHNMARKEFRNLSDDQVAHYLRAIYSSIKQSFPGKALVIKPHPAEGPFLHFHKEAVELSGVKAVIVDELAFRKSFVLYDLIAAARFVVAYPSTTFLESILMKKLCMMVNVPGSSTFLDQEADNRNFFVVNSSWNNLAQDINQFFEKNREALLNKNMNDEEVLSVLEKHIYKFDGNASRRIVSVIGELFQ